MPKPHTFPTLFDYCKNITITDLKRWGYLNPNQKRSGVLTFSRGGEKTGSISIEVYTNPEENYIDFSYRCNDIIINYRVQLVSITSNLGKGAIWFFRCQRTGRKCRKLYLADTYFFHRKAFRNCMYDSQTQSHKNRILLRLFDRLTKKQNASRILNRKHFKKQYNGKPTRRYLKFLSQIKNGEGISETELLLS